MGTVIAPEALSMEELVQLGAVDTSLFCHSFFPKAFRGPDASYDAEIWAALENPNYRLVNLEVHRGGAKTTRLRAFAAKRIAYGISRTILYVGASESHATRSVQWIRNQIQPMLGKGGQRVATQFARTFDLKPGSKWQEHEIEVFHGVDQRPIWILGAGITSTIRGINFDDYRPDLIIVDDVVTDENAATREQCNKIIDLINGALKNSLESEVDQPNAKMVMLQTPISVMDASAMASKSEEWHTESFGCWTPDTELLPVEQQVSAWPGRFTTKRLRKEKKAALANNTYSSFAREMECKLISAEQCAFRVPWLRKLPERPKCRRIVISIDPVPPPSPRELETGMVKKDWEAISVCGANADGYHVLDYALSKGHDPNWTWAKCVEFHREYHPMCWVCESISAQRYLKWFLEKEMQRTGLWAAIKETRSDKRRKHERIIGTLSGIASNGKLTCQTNHSEFILQFESYGIGYKGHDDLLDAVSNGMSELTMPYLELGTDNYDELFDDATVAPFSTSRPCP